MTDDGPTGRPAEGADGEIAPAPTVVRARPRRLTVVCRVGAGVVVTSFAVLAVALGGSAVFGLGDQIGMVALGLFLAAGFLSLTRPRVVADRDGVRIRNIFGGYTLPWGIVHAVRFGAGDPWASLVLADDDTIAVMAVQAADKDRAVDAVLGMRALLAAHRAGAPGDAPPATPS